MGYHTRIEEEITIAPPLTWGEIKDSPFLPEKAKRGRDEGRDCMFHMVETPVDTPDGLLIQKQAVGLVSTREDETRAYNLVEHVQEAVRLYGAGHEFGGRFHCEGETNGDLWRLYVRDGRAVREEPRIVWPDGEVYQAR